MISQLKQSEHIPKAQIATLYWFPSVIHSFAQVKAKLRAIDML